MPPTLYEQTIQESTRADYPFMIVNDEAEPEAEVYMKALINDWAKLYEEMQCGSINLRLMGPGVPTNRTFLLSQKNIEGTFHSTLPMCLHRFNKNGIIPTSNTNREIVLEWRFQHRFGTCAMTRHPACGQNGRKIFGSTAAKLASFETRILRAFMGGSHGAS